MTEQEYKATQTPEEKWDESYAEICFTLVDYKNDKLDVFETVSKLKELVFGS
jgi:hypothetical protein